MCTHHLPNVSDKRIASVLTDAQEQFCRSAEVWANELMAIGAIIQKSVRGRPVTVSRQKRALDAPSRPPS